MRKQVQVYYAGRVQGVGFRYSVRELACGYEVTGYVRNLPDGRVELVAEGEESEVQAFLEAIQKSHLASYVRQVTVHWEPAQDRFTRFEIAY